MSGNSFTPAKMSLSRVFLIEGRARGDHAPAYESCLRMTGISQGFGDVEKIECPDPENYGKFIEVGQVRGAVERPTTSLEGLWALDLKSTLLRLARKGCSVDVQLHLGDCTDPREFNKYKKVVILENAVLTNYSTEDLGALSSGDDAKVNETADITAADVYEVVPLTFAERAGSLVTNEVIDAIICDTQSCGECATESDGCQKVFCLTKAAGGSSGTPADIDFTIDGGTTWYAHDVDSLGAAVEPNALDCIGSYLVVISAADLALHYALKSQFDGITDPTFTKVSTGFVAGGGPRAIKSIGSKAFIVGNSGYVYLCTDPTAGVTVLDAGVATPNSLLAVDALSETFAVAVGGNSTIIKTANGETFETVTGPTGVGINYNTILVKSYDEWWIGTSNGHVYYTLDGGTTWHDKAFTGSGSGVVYDIVQSTDTVMFLSHATTTPRGRILKSIDGGYSWSVQPDVVGNMPLSDRFTSIAACKYDPNMVVGGGLADNGSDGIIVLGYGA